MRKMFGCLCVAAIGLAGPPTLAQVAPKPADSLHDFWRDLTLCFGPTRLSSGSALTVRFALKRDGSLFGEPRIAYAKLPDDEAARKGDLATIRAALDHCVPVKITEGLGGAIAGRPIVIRFVGGKPEQAA